MFSYWNKATLFNVLLLVAASIFTNTALAEVYRWKDENGKIHFSDQPPKSDKQKTDKVKVRGLLSEEERFNNLKNEVGKVELKSVAHGQYQQYIPEGALAHFKIVVVNHGMFSDDETAVESAENTLKKWIRFANKTKAIIIAPAFENYRYAVTKHGAGKGGYRGLFGRHVGADEFLHEIIQEYTFANRRYDGRFYLSGHSAGAQFANRYLVRHPERVIAAAFSAPAWFAQPSTEHKWPYGMGRRTFTAQWLGEFQKRPIDIQPDPKGWLLATQRPVEVVVGELDLKPIRHVPGIGGDTHVHRAKHWVEIMNLYAESFDKRGLIELVLMPNVGHNYGKLARECQNFLTIYI